jgi:hypothetical protein
MIRRLTSVGRLLVGSPRIPHRRSMVGIDSLLALVAFGTLGFLWAILPNVNPTSEATKEVNR